MDSWAPVELVEGGLVVSFYCFWAGRVALEYGMDSWIFLLPANETFAMNLWRTL